MRARGTCGLPPGRGTSFEVCGPLRLGDTRDIKDCYRLLAALRVLVSWMSLDFREWVESIV